MRRREAGILMDRSANYLVRVSLFIECISCLTNTTTTITTTITVEEETAVTVADVLVLLRQVRVSRRAKVECGGAKAGVLGAGGDCGGVFLMYVKVGENVIPAYTSWATTTTTPPPPPSSIPS
ncbi:hypothetical protein M0802_004926 [Mischocyttarus mexicanus]|nr:hypothetical protein M0802_004926 [Mischocyttarus mexicanus]